MNRRLAAPVTHDPGQNHLLAALKEEEFQRLSSKLELVPMPLGDMLYQSGDTLTHAFFPTTSIVSLHYITESGSSSEIASVGHEGVVGTSLILGGASTSSSAIVQTGGHGYRLERRVLVEEFNLGGQTQSLLLRYTQALMTQMFQTAVCNRHHSVEQQLCRWLLMTLDRVPSGQLLMTQDLVAGMLGVRRGGITEAAGRLQRAGFISYRRGQISVLSRPGLETLVCECYAVVRKELMRLLSDAPQRTATAT